MIKNFLYEIKFALLSNDAISTMKSLRQKMFIVLFTSSIEHQYFFKQWLMLIEQKINIYYIQFVL